MARYIDADVARARLMTLAEEASIEGTDFLYYRDVIEAFDDVETADVAPVVHAHWVIKDTGLPICSHCEGACVYKADYCPNCGAKMDEEVK